MEVNAQLQAIDTLFVGRYFPVSTTLEAGWALEPVGTFWKRNLLFLPGMYVRSSVVKSVAFSLH
jgi:hypothetical protein